MAILAIWLFPSPWGLPHSPGLGRGLVTHTYLGHGDYIWGRDPERDHVLMQTWGGGKEGLKVSDGPTPHVPHMKTSQLGSYWQRWTN